MTLAMSNLLSGFTELAAYCLLPGLQHRREIVQRRLGVIL